MSNQFALANNDFVCDGVHDVCSADTPTNRVGQADFNFLTAINNPACDTSGRSTILGGDDHVLADVGQFTSQVTRVSGFKSRIRQTFSSSVSRAEVFKNGKSFTEVRLNWCLDDFTAWLGHQPSHTGELSNLFLTTTGTGICHQVDWVQVVSLVSNVVLQFDHHRFGDGLASVRPDIENLVITFLIGDDSSVVQFLLFQNFSF